MALSVSSFPAAKAKAPAPGLSPVEGPLPQDAGKSKSGFRAFFQKLPSNVPDVTGSSTGDSRHRINMLPNPIRTMTRARSRSGPSSFSFNSAGADFSGPSTHPGWVGVHASSTPFSLPLPLYRRSKSKFLPQNAPQSQTATLSPASIDNSPGLMTQVRVTKEYATYPGPSSSQRPGRHNVGVNERFERSLPQIPSDTSSPTSDTSPLSSGSLITPTGSARDPAIKMSPDSPPSSFNWQRRPLPPPPISRSLSTGPSHRHKRPGNHPRSASETFHPEDLPSPSKSAPIMNHNDLPVWTKSSRDRPLPNIPLGGVSPTVPHSPRPLVSPGPRSSSLNRIGHRTLSEQHAAEGASFSSMANSLQSIDRRSAAEKAVGPADPVQRGRHARPNYLVLASQDHVLEEVNTPIAFSTGVDVDNKDDNGDGGADSDDSLTDQDDMSEGDLHEAWHSLVVQAPRQWLTSDALKRKPPQGSASGRHPVPKPMLQHQSPSRSHERLPEPRPPGGVTSPETRPRHTRRDEEGKTGTAGTQVVDAKPRETRPPDDVVVVTACQPTSRGVEVWEERAVEDVIPKLRQLKLSAKKRN